jgi:uncharacterized protein
MADDIDECLGGRLGALHARQRLGLEEDHEAGILGNDVRRFRIEQWHAFIRNSLRVAGLYRRARRNAERVEIRRTQVVLRGLPRGFDGFTVLHLSDLHVDMNPGAMRRASELIAGLGYDLCVMTGDYRGRTYGPFEETLAGLERLCGHLDRPIYAVLGNHDSLRMVRPMERFGVRVLLNEAVMVERGGERLALAGVDDAHYYRLDNIEKALSAVPHCGCSILLSHTPEIYRQAAHAGIALMLSGHTHGGQICLPGAVPITLRAALPRRMGAGLWRYGAMTGYTSVGLGSGIVPVRLNCPPEIALHRLERA